MRVPPSRLPRLLPLDEVAHTLHVSIKTVRRWIQQGALHAHQFGRQLRVAEEDLAVFINRARS
jgi:excisionase family DNA binding protein